MARPAACLAIGDATYRIAAPGEHADYTVRIDPAAAAPDIRIQLTETLDEADFVFVDDGGGAALPARQRSVKIDAAAPARSHGRLRELRQRRPTIASTCAPVRSSPEAAAALYAAAHLPARRLARHESARIERIALTARQPCRGSTAQYSKAG